MKLFSKKHCIAFICLFTTLLWCNFACAIPAEVIIIRHGEKPPAGDCLSPRGEQRANALVQYFLNNPKLTKYGTPVAIYAEAPHNSTATTRAILTCTPTANALNIVVQSPYTRDEYAALAQDILNNQQYSGKTILICWEHKTIPLLANALGVQPMPPSWPKDVFDRTLVINYQPNGEISSFQNLPQHLLDGDSIQ